MRMHIRQIALMLVLSMLIALLPVAGMTQAEVYSATTQGFGGSVTVELTIEDGKITAATAEGNGETVGIGTRAIEALPGRIVENGTVEIDVIAGATVSSKAVISAARAAYSQATGADLRVKMKPGKYTNEAYGYSRIFPLPVTIEVSETQLLSIEFPEFDEHGETMVILQSVIDKLVPRMLEKQSVSIDAVTGATATSGAVKTAVEASLLEALVAGGSDPAAIQNFYIPTVKDKLGVVEEMETDILVVGLGTAGVMSMMSAVETMQAANPGEKVNIIGIEKAGKVGGQSAMTHEPFAVNPIKYQEEYNNGENYVDVAAMRESWLAYTTGEDGTQKAKVELVDLMLNESGNTIDWLRYEHGYSFGQASKVDFSNSEFICLYNYLDSPASNSITYEDRRAAVDGWLKDMLERVEAAGGSYMLETEGYEFLYDETTGSVVGAKARNLVDGTEYVIKAKAVIMATGGYGGNDEMLNRFFKDENWKGDGWLQNGMHQNDGKMFQAALDIGAGMWNAGIAPHCMSVALPMDMHEFEVHRIEGERNARTGRVATWSINDIPLGLLLTNDILAINRVGERFCNEYGIRNNIGDTISSQSYKAGPYFFGIYSDEHIKEVEQIGFTNNIRWPGYSTQGGVPLNTPMDQIYEVLDVAMDMGYVYKADTLEELAVLINVNPETLVNTVTRYNELCEKGVDEDFEKDPQYLKAIGAGPYYAIKGCAYGYGSAAALDIDVYTRVLKADGATPIHGLYAIGGDSVGVLYNEDKNYLPYGGVAQGWVVTSGRLSGINCANYVLSK